MAAAADGDSTDPIRATEAPTKTKNLTSDFAARGLTVAAFPLQTGVIACACDARARDRVPGYALRISFLLTNSSAP